MVGAPDMTLENEIAFVSGASRGIGKEIALELGRQGAVVVGTATSETGAENISNYLKENTINGLVVAMNVSDQGRIDAALKRVRGRPWRAEYPGQQCRHYAR